MNSILLLGNVINKDNPGIPFDLLSILSTIGIGSIIVALLTHFLNSRSKVSDIDVKRFDYYKYIYFTGLVDNFYNKVDKEITVEFMKKLHIQVSLYNRYSLLLSKNVLKMLDNYNKKQSNKNLRILKSSITSDYKTLKRKLGYNPVLIREHIYFYISYGVLVLSAGALLTTGSIIFDLFLSFGFIEVFSNLKYVWGHFYAFIINILVIVGCILFMKEKYPTIK